MKPEQHSPQTGQARHRRLKELPMEQITQERIQTFIEAMGGSAPPHILELEKEAMAEGVPIIRPQTRSLIRFLMALKRPETILEIGAGTGYSASVMLEYAPQCRSLTTIELDPDRAAKARQVLERAEKKAQVITGDAADVLPTLSGEFDFIFMDAAKGQYINLLPEIFRLLSPQGILLSDNIFKEGEILNSRFAVKRRDRTIHKRMREYLHALTHDERLATILLQDGDGAAVSVRK